MFPQRASQERWTVHSADLGAAFVRFRHWKGNLQMRDVPVGVCQLKALLTYYPNRIHKACVNRFVVHSVAAYAVVANRRHYGVYAKV